MKLSNFEMTSELPGHSVNSKISFAEVDCTAGFWFWKKTERRKIYAMDSGILYLLPSWKFIKNGETAPSHEIRKLENAYRARSILKGQK